ncbi:hypothetical protein ACP_1377 [Acidobacterium capsulatum ATCC 51196]|uniref:Uncharacterized protein n=1 Tax=Acidobacterium capsulatum (strain ATCC 51196 / DSM 11244 / BCRC 80197 / JCM 7670 / NBRC 15755 / NCIMB 13165 / 161) TaxID=240015 RepID=C1F5X0_ACIC5|nr:hypothetical protein ACP_1377 [Acidobacterium capsulatum ATCC 51196]
MSIHFCMVFDFERVGWRIEPDILLIFNELN